MMLATANRLETDAHDLAPMERPGAVLARFVEHYDYCASVGKYGAFQVGSGRLLALPADRDVRIGARAEVPVWDILSPVRHPDTRSRGEAMRALAPHVAALGVSPSSEPRACTAAIELVSLLVDVLFDGASGRLVPEPRFLFVGRAPVPGGQGTRGHLVVLDPLGDRDEPSGSAKVAWLSGSRRMP
jgi:hypothetical protein